MSTEMVKADSYAKASLDERRAYVSAIAQAGDLLPKSLWAQTRNPDGSPGGLAPSPAKVLLLAETGTMLGLHPMAALQSIHIIEGKPTLSANLLAALVRRAGHKLRVTTSGDWQAGTFVARAALIRSDDPEFEFVVEWGKERAQRAGLLGKKGPWSSYPEAMAKARAITEVIREGAPDVTIVAAYTPEELGATNVAEDGSVVEVAASTPMPAPAPAAQNPPVDPVAVEDVVDAEVVEEPEATAFDVEGWASRLADAGDVDALRTVWDDAKAQRALSGQMDAAGTTLGEMIQRRKARLLEQA